MKQWSLIIFYFPLSLWEGILFLSHNSFWSFKLLFHCKESEKALSIVLFQKRNRFWSSFFCFFNTNHLFCIFAKEILTTVYIIHYSYYGYLVAFTYYSYSTTRISCSVLKSIVLVKNNGFASSQHLNVFYFLLGCKSLAIY